MRFYIVLSGLLCFLGSSTYAQKIIKSIPLQMEKIETWEEIALTYSINTTGALVGLDRILPMVIQARNLGWKSMLVPLILLLP